MHSDERAQFPVLDLIILFSVFSPSRLTRLYKMTQFLYDDERQVAI